MLTLTPTAAEAVRALVAGAPIDDDGGLRIAPGEQTPEGTALELALVEGPESEDQAIDEGGAHVYVESHVAPFLDDKVLDATIETGGQVRFSVQEPGETMTSENGGPPENA